MQKDHFFASRVEGIRDEKLAERLNREAVVKLLERIGPAVLLTHSQSGLFGWSIADARPDLVKGIIAIEPGGPPIKGIDTTKVAYTESAGLAWGVSNGPIAYDPPISNAEELRAVLDQKNNGAGTVACYVQPSPARKLKNLQSIPVLFLTSEASYHRVYDHCLVNWLQQAGVSAEHVELEKAGLVGNGHMMMLEKNSDQIAAVMLEWIEKTIPPKD